MGQQPSKKPKKGGSGKDKDKDAQQQLDAFLEPLNTQGAADSPPASLSKAVGAAATTIPTSTSPSTKHATLTLTSPDEPTPVHTGKHRAPSPSPTHHSANANGSSAPDDLSSLSLSTTASTSPATTTTRPAPAPLDIPNNTHTILSNAGGSVPGASESYGAAISPSDGIGGSLANGGGKDRLKGFDVDDMIQRLLDVGYTGKVSKSLCLKNAEIAGICQAAREVFLNQPTLIELSPPVKIVGDVHGQYSDLIRLFEMCGFPPAANYLFLGDYVDRGKQSLETILLLLCYKIKYPENFFLLRGNHECANVTRGG